MEKFLAFTKCLHTYNTHAHPADQPPKHMAYIQRLIASPEDEEWVERLAEQVDILGEKKSKFAAKVSQFLKSYLTLLHP